MLAIRAMLTVLDDRVKATSRPLQENVVPIVSAFCQMAHGDRVIRKYLRQEVLPPLGRVGTTRPEEGHLIRNELVRLMTSPMEDIKVGGYHGSQLEWFGGRTIVTEYLYALFLQITNEKLSTNVE